jgi:hypothetical protein
VANEISAVFNQGVLELPADGKGKVAMHFTAPQNAQKVEIKFFEVDSWVSNGKTIQESNQAPRLLGTTGGYIAASKYKETSQSIPFPSAGAKQLLTVDIDGSLVTMPLPDPNHDVELDFFEVSFTVTGTVNGAPASYQSPSPLFVRNTPTPRAEAAIITGDGSEFASDPSTTRYFEMGAKFWENLQDNERTNLFSIESIFQFLRDDSAFVVRNRNNLPWGRVNIVCHGDDGWNEAAKTFTGTWYIRKKDGEDISQGFGVTAADLGSADVGSPPPARPEVDEHTDIIMRGCLLGYDVKLLNAIRDKFGGLATVYAPKFENEYRVEGKVTRDRLLDSWSLFLPGNVPVPDVKTMVPLLNTRYQGHPLYGGYSGDDWKKVAGITGAIHDGASEFRMKLVDSSGDFSAEFEESEVKGKNQAQLTTLMRTKFPDTSNREWNSRAWHWTVKPPDKQTQFATVTGRGVRTTIEIFRILTTQENGKTVPVTPDYKNPAQYGRSA